MTSKFTIPSLIAVTVLLVALLGAALGVLPAYLAGKFASSDHEAPEWLILDDADRVVELLEDDPRGPVRELSTTNDGVLAVFDEAVALFGTAPVVEVWSRHDLGGATAAGVTADRERVVVAYEGSALLSGRTRWLVLEADTGKVIDAHWTAEAPQDVVSVLTAEARIVLSDDGRIEARSLEEDRELWSHDQGCENTEVAAVGARVTVVGVCGDKVRSVELSAGTGTVLESRSWPGTETPELLALTPTTIPGGADDPVERLLDGEWAQGYLDLGDVLGEADYLPPRVEEGRTPTRLLLIEDPQDAQNRFALEIAGLFLEQGTIHPEDLQEAGLTVDGALPDTLQGWDTGVDLQSARLHDLLTEVVAEQGSPWEDLDHRWAPERPSPDPYP